MGEKRFLDKVNRCNQFIFDIQRFGDGVVATVKLGDADDISFTDIEEAFSAISASDAKDITLTMKQVVSLSSPLDLEIADTVTFKNPDWLVCHPDSNKPTLRIKSGTFIIDKVNLEGDRELVENMGVKDNGTAIADEAEVIMYMPVGEDNQPMYINMKDVSSARIASTSDSIPIYFDTFEHAMNHLDEDDQTVIVMETADSGLDGVLSYTGTGAKEDQSFKLEGLAKASDITVGADKNFDITAANFSSDGITVVDGGKYTFNLVSSADAPEAPTSFTGSDGDETVNNLIPQLKINGADGVDQITNVGASVSIDGGAGNDDIYNDGDNISIDGGAGNDSIDSAGDNVSINAGAGNDDIYNYGDNVSIDGGVGGDDIGNSGKNVTINGGADSDTITNIGTKTLIDAGDGVNYIFNYSSDNTIIGGDDGDYILNSLDAALGGSTDNVLIVSGAGNDTISNDGDFVTIDAGAGDDIEIVNYGASVSIDLGDGMDAIGNKGDNVTINGGAGFDTINNWGMYASINGGDTADLIYNLALVDKEGYIIKLPDNTTINGGDGADFIYNQAGYEVVINGDDGADYIVNEYGNSVVINGGEGNDTIGSYADSVTVDGGTGDDYLEIEGDDVLFKYASGDGNDTISGFNETSTLSIDEGTGSYSTQVSGNDIIVTVGDATISLEGAASLSTVNIDGKEDDGETTLILTNDSKAKVTLASSITSADASSRTKKGITIVGNSLANTIVGSSKNDSLLGKDGADSLSGGKGADKLWGGNGNDTLWGGTGNDTLNGGKGNDLFVYTSGSDVIADYAAGDVISIGSAISSAYAKGSDVLIKTAKGTLTVKNAKDAELSLIDSTGNALSTIVGDVILSLTDDSASKVSLPSTVGAAEASARTKAITIVGNTLNNTILGGTGKDQITGSSGDDVLMGDDGNDKLWGGTGNDTLWGGNGNDTLIGGAGSDSFIYAAGEGKDVITDFANDDMLQITGNWSAAYVAADNAIYFKVDSAYRSVTLKNFTADTFNINGDTYAISNKKLVKQ